MLTLMPHLTNHLPRSTDIVTPAMWKRAVRALGVGVEAATSPACMVPLMVRGGA